MPSQSLEFASVTELSLDMECILTFDAIMAADRYYRFEGEVWQVLSLSKSGMVFAS